MKNLFILIALSALLVGCGPKADVNVSTNGPEVGGNTARFKLKREVVIYDELAYGAKRGVYTLIDTQTGKEYIGISGVGISETGSHSSGKSTASDER